MKKVKRFIRRWWWAFLAVAGIVFAVLWKILGPKEKFSVQGPLKPPTFVERARDKVERVHLEGEVEKAKVRATADVQRETIEEIEKKGKTNPAEARKDMAAWLAKNL